MKIALVIEHFDPSRGGREVSTAQVAMALARRGHDVTIFCQSCRDACDGVRVLPLKTHGLDRAQKLASFVKSVRGAAAEGDFDILHATLPVPGANVYQPRGGLLAAQAEAGLRRRRGWSRIAAALGRHLNPHRRKLRQLERKLLRNPNTLCLAVSEMVAREFLHYHGLRDGARVIYNAVDVPDIPDERRRQWRREFRQQVNAVPDGPLFLTVANNFVLKGVRETIDAFAQWYQSDSGVAGARLVIVGAGKARRYRLLAGRRGVGKQVAFPGQAENIFQWYAAADAVVLLSWYDPCSRVVLEAARWGIPSITTAYNGAGETLAGGAGIVVSSPRETAAVVEALADLADPARRAERSRACLALADRLGMDRHVDELLEVYAQITGKD